LKLSLWYVEATSSSERFLPFRRGIGVGLFLAAVTTQAIAKFGIGFAVPYGTLLVFVGIAIAAGMLAAILPARRASRLDVLTALQYE
jgi:putative ABC transport system permease protein